MFIVYIKKGASYELKQDPQQFENTLMLTSIFVLPVLCK